MGVDLVQAEKPSTPLSPCLDGVFSDFDQMEKSPKRIRRIRRVHANFFEEGAVSLGDVDPLTLDHLLERNLVH